ncbi:FGGY carbohydrate kinase domain-containing protein-like isoform X2 [Babylonia areolata]|uniref:FGGY carbohydrate kinase domain-containing protein-like isoform X2 n=1 Tax=Babylonia areolata TaxID=304850 RepID=UPI003FD1CDD8
MPRLPGVKMSYYLGVDVGTASTRAALVSSDGTVIQFAVEPIEIQHPQPGFYEQSSDDIWRAVIKTVQEVMKCSGLVPSQVKGIGFDATCSMVALGADFEPVSCSTSGDSRYNIIMWMDHRAEKEAAMINSTKHGVLRYVGGSISLEMQPPKLLWLKKNLPDQWKKMAHLFDLPDFLTWRASGSLSRSVCSLVCKWGYEVQGPQLHGWSDDFLHTVGLEELIENDHSRIGSVVQYPGEPCGSGLSRQAACELGLLAGTPVGTSQVDAYAGGMACLACVPADVSILLPPVTSRLALICGTSTCHMVVSHDAVYVPGVWGPYHSAMIPGLWSNEGGQSATGKLIDFIVEGHAAFETAQSKAKEEGKHVFEYLNTLLETAAAQEGVPLSRLSKDLHVFPDFHGNRSPLADPSMRGMVCGLTLSSREEDLARLYLATVQGLAYGAKHIVDEMNSNGHDIQILYMCGGLRKNSLFVQTHADALDLPVILPDAEESVLLGAAILGARASGNFVHIQDAMLAMGGSGQVVKPQDSEKRYHEKKHSVYMKMLSDQKTYTSLMTE